MQRLPLLVSLVAAALAGFCAWVVTQRPTPRPDAELAALDARLASLERVLGDRPSEVAPPPAAAPQGAGSVPAAGPGTPTLAAGNARAGVTLPDLERRLAELEKGARERTSTTDELEGRRQAARATIEDAPVHMPTFYGSVDDAAKDLALAPGQKADFERIVADAKREADELHKIPDEEGKTWAQVEKDSFKMEGGAFHLDMTSLQSFREKVIPGRSESYGAADRRIRQNAKRRLREGLSPDQQAKFDKAHTDPLIGGSGDGFGAFTFATSEILVGPEGGPAGDK